MEADFMYKIDIYWLNKYGYLAGSKRGGLVWGGEDGDKKNSVGIYSNVSAEESYVILSYSMSATNGERRSLSYPVRLVTSSCNYGSLRYWFACPQCGRRVGVLYLGGERFLCRHCYNLSYSSRNVNRHYRMYATFRVIEISDKIDVLEQGMKKRFYRGKPTRKQRRIDRLRDLRADSSALL